MSPFSPDGPEEELDRVDGGAVEVGEERGRRGDITLTNDRMLFADPKSGPTTGNLVGDLAASLLEKRTGDRVLLMLADVRSAGPHERRLLPDLYAFTEAGGHSCRLPMKHGRKWEPLIRRALTERHSHTVVADGAEGWRVVS